MCVKFFSGRIDRLTGIKFFRAGKLITNVSQQVYGLAVKFFSSKILAAFAVLSYLVFSL